MSDLSPSPSSGGRQRAIVHIGLPKAGSTSFQLVLFDLETELRRRGARVLVYDGPDDQQAGPTRAFDLANCVVRTDLDLWWHAYLPESALPEFIERGARSIRRQSAEPEELLVASVEDLALIRTPQEVARLTALLAPREVHVVLVLREPEAWVRSLRGHLVAGGYRTSSNWARSCRNLGDDSWLLEFDVLIDLLRTELGPQAVTIIDYEEEMANRGSVLPALWNACTLPLELLPGADDDRPSAWANRSRDWALAAEPPPGTADELEWLRDRVVAQARELARLRGRQSRTRRLAGRISRAVPRD